MKYLLMMNVPGQVPYQMNSWSPQDVQAHMTFLVNFRKKLEQAGEFAGAQVLAAPDRATRVCARDDGSLITDGVFPEAKEFLAGFWMVEVASAARAYDLAGQASAAPGPGGVPLDLAIEVRQVVAGLDRPAIVT